MFGSYGTWVKKGEVPGEFHTRSAVHMITFECDDDYIKEISSQLLRQFHETKDLLSVNNFDQITGLLHSTDHQSEILQRRQLQGVMQRLAEVIVAMTFLEQGADSITTHWRSLEAENDSTWPPFTGNHNRHFLARTALPAHCIEPRGGYGADCMCDTCMAEKCGGFCANPPCMGGGGIEA